MTLLSVVFLSVLIVFHEGGSIPTDAPLQRWDTIVVGLGPAGTSAASTLALAGRRVLALEAQGRVGGRVYTVPFGDGVVELGAEWIQGTEKSPVYELAIKNNISVIPDENNFSIFYSDGSSADQSLIIELLNEALEAYGNPPETATSVGEHVTQKLTEYISNHHPDLVKDKDFVSNLLEWIELNIISVEAANSWNDVSTKSTSEELQGHKTISWHRNGYKTLFELLLRTYNGGSGLPNLEIKLNTEVKNIAWPQEPAEDVVVTTADGTVYRAKNVIVTVSLGVLKERYNTMFTPNLPQAKITAIKDISMGLLAKIIFSFDKSLSECPVSRKCNTLGFIWKQADREAVPAEDRWVTKIVGFSQPKGSSNTLTFWASGDTAKQVEALSENEVKNKLLAMTRQFIGHNYTIPEPTGMIKTSWQSNPYTRGSYSYDNLLTPQHMNGRDILGTPLVDSSGVPRVLFAGEATEPKHYGYVHGAVETGYREANRILSPSS